MTPTDPALLTDTLAAPTPLASADPSTSLGHLPQGRWTFDGDVTTCFDDMLERSIPLYEVMRAACRELALHYAQPQTAVVDVGCSRGGAIADLLPDLPRNLFVGLEVSDPMLAAARERFTHQIAAGSVEVKRWDLREGYPPVRASVTLCVLTLQFTPIEHRLRIVRDIFRSTVPGGVLILVEKVLGETAELDDMMVTRYLALKASNGYGGDEIARKRQSLEGVLVPVTARWNMELLEKAGFRHVGPFWQWMNFAGWVAIRARDD